MESQELFIQFGELKGTVNSLVTVVADMKAAILPALKEQRMEMAQYRDDCREAMGRHKEDDRGVHEKIEVICKPIADIYEWKEGTDKKPGADTRLQNVEIYQSRQKWYATGWAACVGFGVFVFEALKK